MDLTSSVEMIFTIFNSIYDFLKNNGFTIGTVTFSFASLFWSILAVSLVVWVIRKVIYE